MLNGTQRISTSTSGRGSSIIMILEYYPGTSEMTVSSATSIVHCSTTGSILEALSPPSHSQLESLELVGISF